MIKNILKNALLCASIGAIYDAQSAPILLGVGELNGSGDKSRFAELLENGVDRNDALGGLGSGLAWAGGNRFLALPDRGPNATAWNSGLDDTTSYIPRYHEIEIKMDKARIGATLPLRVTIELTKTTPLYSPVNLHYGAETPSHNATGRYYFSGRSDNFAGEGSLFPLDGRLDPEGICLSSSGTSVYVSDEYGPKVLEFSRYSGKLTRAFKLPSAFDARKLSGMGSVEISGNTAGRVANKGMEGLTITPDGTTLVGFEQSPLIQDGGDGGRANRIVTINLISGETHQYVYDNYLADKTKAYNSSEILAINDHEFLVLERDGKGLGDGSDAKVKRLLKIDLKGATDIGALNNGQGVSGQAGLLTYAVNKSLFLDIKSTLNAYGYAEAQIPAKLEGAAFGKDIKVNDQLYHTLLISNDNDFLPAVAGSNKIFVFGFTDADLGVDAQSNPTVLVRQF